VCVGEQHKGEAGIQDENKAVSLVWGSSGDCWIEGWMVGGPHRQANLAAGQTNDKAGRMEAAGRHRKLLVLPAVADSSSQK